ncbi:MAG: thioredoxin family protein [Candidatus Melainabacteria bacterium]|nr:thioredoxin family protein [Candidatus Melainabacteria bacterium]
MKRTSPEEIEKITKKVNNSKLILLDIYHDRCESCKYIDPVIEKLKVKYSDNPAIVFLRYDISNPFTIFDSRKIAKQVGLENIYRAQRFSGIVLFIDAKNKQTSDTLISEYNLDKYIEIIEKRLNAT